MPVLALKQGLHPYFALEKAYYIVLVRVLSYWYVLQLQQRLHKNTPCRQDFQVVKNRFL